MEETPRGKSIKTRCSFVAATVFFFFSVWSPSERSDDGASCDACGNDDGMGAQSGMHVIEVFTTSLVIVRKVSEAHGGLH